MIINTTDWTPYLGQIVIDPDGDRGELVGVHFTDGLCINGVWWGERSIGATTIEINNPNQQKLFNENQD